MDISKILQILEKYEDPEFKFYLKNHKYTFNGDHYISVTQFISRFHKKFDSEFWSQKKANERGVKKEDILLEWKNLNDRANFIGTSTHNWIENYFNKIYQELPNDLDVIDRINKFNKLFGSHLWKLEPIKFEQRIFSKKWKIAGTIDSIFKYGNKIIILDWKTNKSFTKENKWEKLLEPFDEWDACHLNEYSIQLSLYSLILKEVGINIDSMLLVYIGPDHDAKIYKCFDFTSHLESYLETKLIHN